ncbi:Eaa1 [Klebsiella pneumoniae]|nr:Eaa1 [Klebsiella pneumoniae]
MTKSTITREQLLEIIETDHVQCGEASYLARMALAAMDSEPVAWTWHYREQWHVTNDKCRAEFVATDGDVAVLPLYRHAQPASERDQVRIAHAEWSQATFGNVGPVGPLKHLSKEALEAAEQPGDLSEWADMQFLMWDAQRRAGITDEQITQAMIDKLAVNKQREWPEPKDGEPRLHIKGLPAPVVEREPIAWLNDAYLARGVVDGEAGSEDAGPGYIPVYREAGTQPAPGVPESMPDSVYEILCAACGDKAWAYADLLWNECRAAMLAAAQQEGK